MTKDMTKDNVDARLEAARKRKAKVKAAKSSMKLGKLGIDAITKI